MIFLLFSQSTIAEVKERKNVLILSSYGNESSISSGYEYKGWTDEIITSINSQFAESEEDIHVRMEYMGLSYENWPQYYELYKDSFSNIKFDAVISLDDNAYKFLLKYGEDLFPNTPVLFSGVYSFNESIVRDHPLFTGITKSNDIEITLDTALKLHPNAKEIFIIDDNEEVMRWMVNLYADKVKIVFSDDDNIEKVKERIRNLPKDTVIYYSKTFIDDNGQAMPIDKSIDYLFKDSNIPIYSRYYVQMCKQSVGGVVTNGTSLGKEVAGLTLRVLNGEKPSDIRVVEDSSHNYVFNYDKLKQFNIDLDELPEDSQIVNGPATSYTIAKELILGLAAIIIIVFAIGLILIKFNVRKRRLTEKLLSNSETLISTLINSSPNIFYFKSPEGEILEINNIMLRILNINEKDYKGILELPNIPINKIPLFIEWSQKDKEAWEKGVICKSEESIFDEKANINKVYDTLRIPLFNDDGTHQGLIFLGIDITDQKSKEKNEKRINELLYYDELRANFFSNISHELKTPLNLIFSALQIIELKRKINSNDEKNIKKYISTMRQNCYRLLRIIDNLIDITKIDAGHFIIHKCNRNIVSVVENIVLSIVDYVEEKGINITFDTEIEEKIMAFDPDAMERIILNLLSNSIKFTPSGGAIEVNIYDNVNSIVISVKDSGVGIPLDKQSSIFEKFVQVDKTLSRNREGSGIGLSLVKELVVLHEGTIQLNSELDNGSEFIIELPVRKVDEKISNKLNDEKNEGKVDRVNIEFSDIYS